MKNIMKKQISFINDNNQIVLTFYATDGVISYVKAE